MPAAPTKEMIVSELGEQRGQWRSVLEMLASLAALAEQQGIYHLDARGSQDFRTYGQLYETACRVGQGLVQNGVGPGDRVLIVQRSGFDFLTSFFGAVAIGAVPVPLPHPLEQLTANPLSTAAYWTRQSRRLGAQAILVSSGMEQAHRPRVGAASPYQLASDLPTLLESVAVEVDLDPLGASPHDVAYVQCTSGATGARRGVIITHDNILSSMGSVGHALAVGPQDIGVSWLPLDNIMGLVGTVFVSMYWGINLILIEPERFLRRPEDWLWTIARHKGTLSPAPNFAFNYCVRRCKESDLEGLDLATWRVAMNGSEPVRAQHMEAFVRRFRKYGLRPDVFLPVYGLSEATLAVTFGAVNKPPVIDGINRAVLEREGRAQELPASGAPTPAERMHLVSVGTALHGVDVRVVDAENQPVAERVCGEVALRGPNVMKGYIEGSAGEDPQEECTRRVDDWLLTGDIGYMANGQLFIVGRKCERIFIESDSGPRCIFAEEVEFFVNAVEGVRSGSAAVFDVLARRESSNTLADSVHIVVAYETQAGAESDEVDNQLKALLKKHLDLDPDVIVRLSPRSIPRTQSGKVRRFLARQLYLDDKLDRRRRNVIDLFTVVRGARKMRRDLIHTGRDLLQKLDELIPRKK